MSTMNVNDLAAVSKFIEAVEAAMVETGISFGVAPTLVIGESNWIGDLRTVRGETLGEDWHLELDTSGH